MTDISNNSNVLSISIDDMKNLFSFITESRLPVCFWGVKAVGKTTVMHEIGETLGYNVVVLHLATQDIVDLIGMPTKIEVYPGKYEMIWSKPEWLKTDSDKPTIYFLDEFNRGNKFVMAAMLPFLNEGKIHTHSIGSKDVVVAACNPSNGKYVVNDAFEQDEALRDRCGHVILEPTNKEWIRYAENKNLSTTLSVIDKNPEWINIEKFKLPFQIKPSRRSLINVMEIVDNKDDKWIRKFGNIIIGSYLGTDFLNEWWDERFKDTTYLTIKEIQNFDRNKTRIKDAISTIYDGKIIVKNDIFEASVDIIVEWIEKEYRDGLSDIDWIFKYFSLDFIPKDSLVGMLSRINVIDKPILLQKLFDTNLLDSFKEISNSKKFAA